MIVINLDVMLAKRKMSMTELSQRVGITMANLSILKNGKSKAIRLSTLDAVCTALQCQPGDVLAWQPEGEVQVDTPQRGESQPAPERHAHVAEHLKKHPATEPKHLTVDTNGSRLNLRDRDSRGGTVIGKLPNGAQVELLEKRGQWARISWEGKSGWVLATYLKEQD